MIVSHNIIGHPVNVVFEGLETRCLLFWTCSFKSFRLVDPKRHPPAGNETAYLLGQNYTEVTCCRSFNQQFLSPLLALLVLNALSCSFRPTESLAKHVDPRIGVNNVKLATRGIQDSREESVVSFSAASGTIT